MPLSFPMMNGIKTLKAFSNDWQYTNNWNQCIYTHWTIIQMYIYYIIWDFFSCCLLILVFVWLSQSNCENMPMSCLYHYIAQRKQNTILSNKGCHYCLKIGKDEEFIEQQRKCDVKRDVSKVSLSSITQFRIRCCDIKRLLSKRWKSNNSILFAWWMKITQHIKNCAEKRAKINRMLVLSVLLLSLIKQNLLFVMLTWSDSVFFCYCEKLKSQCEIGWLFFYHCQLILNQRVTIPTIVNIVFGLRMSLISSQSTEYITHFVISILYTFTLKYMLNFQSNVILLRSSSDFSYWHTHTQKTHIGNRWIKTT